MVVARAGEEIVCHRGALCGRRNATGRMPASSRAVTLIRGRDPGPALQIVGWRSGTSGIVSLRQSAMRRGRMSAIFRGLNDGQTVHSSPRR
jgi:hypothetical protein